MKKKIVFMGNSLVNGFPFGRTKSFPGVMRRKMKAAGQDINIVNCGVNGESSVQMLRRFDTDVISRTPDYVFISCGVNDFIYRERGPREVFENIETMSKMAESAGIKVVLMTPPFVHEEMATRIWLVGCGIDYAKVNTQISALRQLIIGSGREYFDLHAIYPECGEYLDGLHPTESGYEFIADRLIQLLEERLIK
ncbi:MAG: GDSL-type esterase/lipase family protein [Firmicutes bacterium]|nr:GDSL-type esterase/lipase family protein [Bacillota bacterium]